jgi:hypothetical protein
MKMPILVWSFAKTSHPRNPSPKKQPQRRPAKPAKPQPPELLRTRFCIRQLLRHFHKLLPASLLATWLALSEQAFYQRALTPLITLWYLLFQRLSDNHRLSQAVEEAREGGADHLSPRGKTPLSQQLKPEVTTSFSDARHHLPLELLLQTLWHTATQTSTSIQTPQWFGLKVGLIDGSTCRLSAQNSSGTRTTKPPMTSPILKSLFGLAGWWS